jgi:6-phosphogluconolactonase
MIPASFDSHSRFGLPPARQLSNLQRTPRRVHWVLRSVLAVFAMGLLAGQGPTAVGQVFWVGGYGPGIYASRLNPDGSMVEPKLVATQSNPSFMALHPTRDVLYCVTETMQEDPAQVAAIVAYAFDRRAYLDGSMPELKRISVERVNGDVPCHVVIDSEGRFAIVANYISGSVSMFPIQDDGSLQKECFTVQHQGSGPNAARQKGPHAHCSAIDPTNRWVLVADLGIDKVLVYALDATKQTLPPSQHPELVLPPGSGPRHIAFHPSGKFVYIINELGMTLTAAKWDGESGKLETLSNESTVPEGKPSDGWSTAEVLVHPSGRFVYGSNRGHHTIALFSIHQTAGTAKRIENFDTLGKTPRNFRIDPKGQFLLAENQDSNTIHSFRIDSGTGILKPTGHTIRTEKPACIKFLLEPVGTTR